MSSRVLRTRIAGGVALVALLLTATTSALGHSGSFIPKRYARVAPEYRVPVYFDKRVPGGRTRSRIRNGARMWTAQGRQIAFVVQRRAIRAPNDPCKGVLGDEAGKIDYEKVDGPGPRLAVNTNCFHTSGPFKGRLAGFRQVYDSKQPNFYRGTGNAPNDRSDLWSTASHEFGHSVGWNRFHYRRDEDNTICAGDNLARETMCGTVFLGQERTRTLGRHDKHTFKRLYPAR